MSLDEPGLGVYPADSALLPGALPNREQRVCQVLGLDTVRRVEVVPLRERLDREVREDRS